MPKPVYISTDRSRNKPRPPQTAKGRRDVRDNSARLRAAGHQMTGDHPNAGVKRGVIVGGATPHWDETQECWVNQFNKPICGAARTGKSMTGPGICCQPAGWGTEHLGYGTCVAHLGTTPTHYTPAHMLANTELAKIVYGAPNDVEPQAELLNMIHRTSGHVQWLADRIAQMESEQGLKEVTAMGLRPSFILTRYDQERQMQLANVKAAISLGISEKQVEIAQQQAKLLAMTIQACFLDPELDLTPIQRIKFPEVIRRHLLQLNPATTIDPDAIEAKASVK